MNTVLKASYFSKKLDEVFQLTLLVFPGGTADGPLPPREEVAGTGRALHQLGATHGVSVFSPLVSGSSARALPLRAPLGVRSESN